MHDFCLFVKDAVTDIVERTLLTDAVDLLLHSQVVTSPVSCDAFYSSIGSGMGLTISGELMNILYYFRVERRFLQAHLGRGLKSYFRYMDDVLMGTDRSFDRVKHGREYVESGGYFRILAESVGSCVQFLEFSVTADLGHYRCEYKLKDEAMLAPLSPSSGHMSALAISWPMALRSRVVSLAYNAANARAVLADLESRFRQAEHPLAPMLNTTSSFRRTVRRRLITSRNDSSEHSRWLVLPYHPEFLQPALAMLRLFDQTFGDQPSSAYGERQVVRAAWARAHRNMYELTRRLPVAQLDTNHH